MLHEQCLVLVNIISSAYQIFFWQDFLAIMAPFILLAQKDISQKWV